MINEFNFEALVKADYEYIPEWDPNNWGDTVTEAVNPPSYKEGQVYNCWFPYNTVSAAQKDSHANQPGNYKKGHGSFRRAIVINFPDNTLKLIACQKVKGNEYNSTRPYNYKIKKWASSGFTMEVYASCTNFIDISCADSFVYQGELDAADLVKCKDALRFALNNPTHDTYSSMNIIRGSIHSSLYNKDGSKPTQTVSEILKSGTANYIDIANMIHIAANNCSKKHAIVIASFESIDNRYSDTIVYPVIKSQHSWNVFRYRVKDKQAYCETWDHHINSLEDTVEKENRILEKETIKMFHTDVNTTSYIVQKAGLNEWDKLISKNIPQKEFIESMERYCYNELKAELNSFIVDIRSTLDNIIHKS